ncbi:MAG: S9 family peptidase [Chloroflexota bacterium]
MTAHISTQDLYRFQPISGCAISPDGQHVVFSVQRVDRKTEKKYSNLWIATINNVSHDGNARQFTFGNHVDTQPQWSPDGTQIAYMSNQHGKSQLTIIPFQGGAPRPVTNFNGRIFTFQWSPDGTRYVCAFRPKDKATIEREQDEAKKRLGIVARHITRVTYKVDGGGYLPDERVHIWVVDAHTGEATQLTDGSIYSEIEPVWSPDGSKIAFFSNRSEDPDFHPGAVDLFVMSASGNVQDESAWLKLSTRVGAKSNPVFSPDGAWIAYYGRDGEGNSWKNMQLWIVPMDGTEPARSLTAHIDQHAGNVSLNDLGGAVMMPPVWSNDGERIFFQTTHRGNTLLNAISTKEPEAMIQPIIHQEGVVGTYTIDKAQSTLAYFFATWRSPGQLWVRGVEDGAAEVGCQLTHLNEDWLNEMELGDIEEVWFKGAADNDLQGWILKPPGFDPSQQYPSILEIHGGPLTQYANCFMHEFYYLAAQGYVVYFCNPRGGRGYGEAHAKAMVNDMGGPDYADVMAWVDKVMQRPYIDHQRMGVTGGSYGGYMTNFIIGRTDRFQAAVTQRCISNRISDFGTKYLNWQRQFVFGGESPWENVENYWRQSPLKDIGGCTTPTLILHSEQDMMCSLEQAEQLYVALKVLGVETELVLFPEESHNLSRSGRTDRRIARLAHILRWFDRYLKPVVPPKAGLISCDEVQ